MSAAIRPGPGGAGPATSDDVTTYTFGASDGWTLTNGSGSAAITGGVARLTMPASTNSGDGGRASITRSLSALANPAGFRILVRLVSLTGGDSNTRVGLYYSNSTNQARPAYVPGSGRMEYLYVGTSAPTLGTLPGVVAWDGTWWVESVVSGFNVSTRVGQGTTTDPPADDSTSWRWVYAGNVFPLWNGGPPFTTFGLYLTTYGAGGGNITVDFDDVIVETLL